MKYKASPFAVVIVAMLAMLAGCQDAIVSPPVIPPRDEPTDPFAHLDFPPAAAGAVVYYRTTSSYIPGRSRYVLHDDSTFALQYVLPDWGFFQYPGRYARADSTISFYFHDGSAAGAWLATGIVFGDRLIVKYNAVMSLSDFEDGEYVNVPDHSANPAYIHIAKADGSAIARLTVGRWPGWSPDGRRIAFHRDGLIYVINADGSGEKPLGAGAFPAWSPDGTRIVFTSGEGISVMNVDGSDVITLVRHDFRDDTYPAGDMGVGKPAWSPDGAHIAFEHFGDGDVQPAQIYLVNADGSTPRWFTASPDGKRYAESDPSWSPDGTRIVFWSFGYGIATTNANGGVPITLFRSFPAVGYGARPTWSPDGSTVAFTVRSSVGPEIWSVAVSGGVTTVVIRNAFDAAWSPDGSRIAFVSGRIE